LPRGKKLFNSIEAFKIKKNENLKILILGDQESVERMKVIKSFVRNLMQVASRK